MASWRTVLEITAVAVLVVVLMALVVAPLGGRLG
jgi:hypothetical protein